MHLSLSDVLFARAAREPDRTAILTPEGTVLYGQVAAEAAALSHLIRELEPSAERLAMLLPNVPRFASVFHGIIGAGAAAVMINPANSRREVAEQLLDSGATATFTTASLAELLPPGARALLVDELPVGVRDVQATGERSVSLDLTRSGPAAPRGGNAEAAVIFTAAEGGRARGAVLSHRNLVANLRSTVEMLGLRPDDRVIAALPQVHAFGLTVNLNAVLAAGAAIIPVERFHPVRTLELIAASRTTILMGVPAMYLGFLSVAEKNGVPEHALRITLTGGASIDSAVQLRWEALFGTPLRQGYGLTEAAPVCLFNDPQHPNRPGTLGVPVPHVQVRILDPRGEELPDGEVGEICVRGENVFSGYLDEQSDEPPYLRDGWLRTGDLGSRDAEGYFRFRGLLKAMFTRSGFNVYPREVERALAEDDRIAAVRVRAQPDPVKENEMVLEVEPAAGLSLSEEEVREICRARLAAYKQPGRIVIGGVDRGGDPSA